MQETIGPVLAEMAREQSVGRIAFSAVTVVFDLKLFHPLRIDLLRVAGGMRRQLPVAVQEFVESIW